MNDVFRLGAQYAAAACYSPADNADFTDLVLHAILIMMA
jgi:hypothetical protein